MKKIYLNLKRFDIPRTFGGINEFNIETYSEMITKGIEKMNFDLPITIYFQEAHLINALKVNKKVNIGCQSVHYLDSEVNGPFGAFTTFRTANSMKALGVKDTIIGHCEERNDLNYLTNNGTTINVNKVLNEKIKKAINANMNVLYCIGERDFEQNKKYDVLKEQLLVGLDGIDLSKITIAYEPVWAIGPGKIPPDRDYILDIVKFIKSIFAVPVVYGGGLKKDNAKMLASIEELDGGLIALTRFGKDFGFYLDDFEEIVKTYMEGLK